MKSKKFESRIIGIDEISQAVATLCVEANRNLPPDVLAALQNALNKETNARARDILLQLIKNSEVASSEQLPLCQDTGLAVFFVELGHELRITGGDIYSAINNGVRLGYENGYLRKSVCDPFSRVNTGDNTPAIVHLRLVQGNKLRIQYMAKGGGSENMSRLAMLSPSEGWNGILEFVLQCVNEARSNPCPPIIVGIGIGGSFELAPQMAKESLLRKLNSTHSDASLGAKELELLEKINTLGIGPMGMGGSTTCLGVHIMSAPCHIASLPVAVNIQCHSSRHGEIEL